ncbi:MAG: hypothetical protein WB988_13045 [Candidatus Nitrosopolaris sp.]|jgi:hypothetical protein
MGRIKTRSKTGLAVKFDEPIPPLTLLTIENQEDLLRPMFTNELLTIETRLFPKPVGASNNMNL